MAKAMCFLLILYLTCRQEGAGKCGNEKKCRNCNQIDVTCILVIERGSACLNVVERLKSKDEAALQALMDQYGDYLLRTAYLLLRDRQGAEEAVQDTFVTAFHKIDQLQEPHQLKGWLTRIAVNRCRMKQRTWSWRMLLPFARMEEISTDKVQPATEEEFMKEWQNKRLSDTIQQLDYKYRESITLFYYNEMSVQEISSYTQVNENTIKARLARGREQLRKLWEKEGRMDGD